MTPPLLQTLINPESLESLSMPSLVLGSSVLLLVGGMTLFALLALPALRGLTMLVGAVRLLMSRAPGLLGSRGFGAGVGSFEPSRPLSVAGLSPGMARLARETRTLALELHRRSEAARHWPEDAGEFEPVRVTWWSGLGSDALDFAPLVDTRREVFDWLQTAERLPTGDRQQLSELGVDVEAVRAALTAEQAVVEHVRALAGLLWSIDERLAGASTSGYRASGAELAVPGASEFSGLSGLPGSRGASKAKDEAKDEDEDEAEDELEGRRRQRRFGKIISAHERGFSRMAGSYAKTPAEREDLEQDIALALWQALPRFRGESTVETFAYRVARYCCYRYVRRRTKLATTSDTAVALLDDPDSCVESWMLGVDARAQVEQARATLPDTLESALRLHLSGLSYAEIGEILGISQQNVSARLTRARDRLRAQLAA